MKRSELRENIFKLVFSLTNEENINEQSLEFYFSDNKIEGKDSEYIKEAINSIYENLDKIDEIIAENSHKYSVDRLSAVTLSVLRVAIWEITFKDDIPNNVSAYEAVKISEKYDDEKAKGYINGILGAYIRKLEGKN